MSASHRPAVTRREWFLAAGRAAALAGAALLAGRAVRDTARGVAPACPAGSPCTLCARRLACTKPEARAAGTGGLRHGG
ncbi:MAG: hypothetical protein FJ221_11945 [Lentisphaerae bacterium]|nr:hypothetical protein [Lentisphaerota bacterium]